MCVCVGGKGRKDSSRLDAAGPSPACGQEESDGARRRRLGRRDEAVWGGVARYRIIIVFNTSFIFSIVSPVVSEAAILF